MKLTLYRWQLIILITATLTAIPQLFFAQDTIRVTGNQLVFHYTFDDSLATDQSGNGFDGTIIGNPEPTSMYGMNGLEFNEGNSQINCNIGDYISLPVIDSIWSSGITICAWVKFTTSIQNYERIIDIGNGTGESNGKPFWLGRSAKTNNIGLGSWIDISANNRTLGNLVSENVIVNNSLQFFCATVENDSMKIYVNGQLSASKKGHKIANVLRSSNFIGRSNWCNYDPDFQGFIGDVKVYNYAFNSVDIENLFDTTNPITTCSNNLQYDALMALYDSTGGANWANNTNWGLGCPCENSWYGVGCDTSNNVTSIVLTNNNLSGAIPPSINQLTSLKTINLQYNQLTQIPSEIEDLTALTSLYLDYNEITQLPPEIGNLSQLRKLGLSDNLLTSLPDSIGNLSSLRVLGLRSNQLTSCPSTIGNLSSIRNIVLMFNELDSIPPEMGNLTTLTELYLGGNNLRDLPDEVANLTNVDWFGLGDNQFTDIPNGVLNMDKLKVLYIWGCYISSLSDSIKNMTSLVELWLGCDNIGGCSVPGAKSGNEFTEFPLELLEIPNLKRLYFGNNNISCFPIEALDLCSQLTVKDFTNNPADFQAFCDSGAFTCSTIPDTCSSDSAALMAIYNTTNGPNWTDNTNWGVGCPCDNNWYGVSCDAANNVTFLILSDNGLQGHIPTEIGNLTSLINLSLSNNQLSSLPASIGNLTNLGTLFLGSNDFTELPAEFSSLTGLSYLFIDNLPNLNCLSSEWDSLCNSGVVIDDTNTPVDVQAFCDSGMYVCTDVVNCNQISNGDFATSDLSGWDTYNYSGSGTTITLSVDTANLKTEIGGSPTASWHASMNQPISFEADSSYELIFKARSATGTKKVPVELKHTESGNTYVHKKIDFFITTTWQTYTMSFNPTVDSDASDIVLFLLADDAQTIWFDDIVFQPVGCSPDNTPPNVPINLDTSNVTSSSVSLAWSPSMDNIGVSGYYIYQYGVVIDTVWAPDTTINVAGLTQGTTYAFQVAAYDAVGNVSSLSSSLTVTLPTPTPGQPCNLIVNGNFEHTDLSAWDTYAYSGTNTTLSISVDSATMKAELTGNPTATWHANMSQPISFEMGKSYDISFQARSTGNKLLVVEVKNNGNSTIHKNVNYQIDATWQTYTMSYTPTVNSDANDVLLFLLADDTQTVWLDDLVFEETGCVNGAPDENPPSVPQNLTASDLSAINFTLSWDTSIDDDQVAGYYIYQNDVLIDSVASPDTSIQITGLSPLTSYEYQVSAYDPSGNVSAFSDSLVITTPSATPGQSCNTLVNGTFESEDISTWDTYAYSGSGTTLTLSVDTANLKTVIGGSPTASWHASMNHPIVFEADSSYELSFRARSATGTKKVPAELKHTESGNTFVHKKIDFYITSTWQTYTMSFDPTVDSDASDVLLILLADDAQTVWFDDFRFAIAGCIDAPTDTTPPSVPTNLATSNINLADSSLILSWNPSTDDDSVRGYLVYQDQVFVDTIWSPNTSILLSGLIPGTGYDLTVAAFDSTGNISLPSTPLSTTLPILPDVSLQELIDCPPNIASSIEPIFPTTERNYIRTTVYREPGGDGVNEKDKWQTLVYVDGLGRPIQHVEGQASPIGVDIVTPIEYDSLGRQPIAYLPYVDELPPLPGEYKGNAISEQENFYSNLGSISGDRTFPKSVTQFEASPLNRVVEQGAPGTAWQPETGSVGSQSGNEHTMVTEYLSNSSAVPGFDPEDFSHSASYYAANELSITRTTDENGAMTETATDKLGRTIYKSVQVSGSAVAAPWNSNDFATTYFVYDVFGNVRYVIQPEGWKTAKSAGLTGPVKEQFCFQYRYDDRQRVINKKVPGADSVTMVYDKLDRVVATQDGNLRLANQWLVTKYDYLGRPVKTGFASYTQTKTRANLQSDVDGNTQPYETLMPSGTDYTNALAPAIDSIHSITYYDGYGFLSDTAYSFKDASYVSFLTSPAGDPVAYTRATSDQGRVTGVKVFVLDPVDSLIQNNELLTVTYYDKYGREIQTVADNHLGSRERVANRYNFAGELLESVQIHQESTPEEVKVHKAFVYDHRGRLLRVAQAINDQSAIILAEHSYDEIGQLVEKDLGGNTCDTVLQSIDYQYNIRGWMTHINQTDAVSGVGRSANDTYDDLFGMQLQYNTGSNALYNGNISSLTWQTNRGDTQADALRGYDFTYDQMNRLLSATYSGTGSENFHVSGIAYDLNGNIESLLRNGKTGPGVNDFGVMDNLSYTYAGNRLRSIQENAIATMIDEVDQFHTLNNNDTLGYDASGNITYDPNKEIHFIYNHLNKPIAADLGGGKKISWIYSADGTKLVQVYSGDSAATHDYVGGFFYKNEELLHLAHEEGRALNLSGIFRYEFNLTDHLGNVRVSFSDIDYNGVIDTNEVLQTDHYYPFGLRLGGLSYSSGTENRYRYNGKEFHQEFNLGLYDYGARMYDPSIGRWNGVDPLAHKMPAWSPYSYTFNNPVLYTDPDGRFPIIPWLLKAGANAGADMLAQASMSYYFDPNVNSWGQAFDNVNYYQVARSGAEGLIPWKTPGGRLGRAAGTAVVDVLVNAANDPSGYTQEQAGLDFATGFIGDLAGGGIGELVTKYGTKSVATGLVKLGFDGETINDLAGTTLSNSDIRTIRSQQGIISEHRDKLAKYKANPDAYDNKGHLKNAPNDKIRQKIIDRRIKHLNDEINAAQKNIDDVFKNSGGAKP